MSGASMNERVTRALDAAARKIEEAERARTEPIAIIGMGCRFPGGAEDPESFWKLLADGIDAVGEYPASRWEIGRFHDEDPDARGKIPTRQGGFLADVDRFDAAFFGISPREAMSLDPQQRLLLEVAWRALEDAGLTREKLTGSATGVYVGISAGDYLGLLSRGGLEEIDPYFVTGNMLNAAAGRIAYALGLSGPAFSVDSACSSSLTALHLACQALRGGDCETALAAGVNLILAPEVFVGLSRARVLSPDGRCKTFDESADGMGRGEGCGVLVLKRLSRARADGDRVLALIRGSAVNQDGASGGLTVPNGLAQEAVIRKALANARVEAPEVDYVEAHGTGTPLGDPIEMKALREVYALGRPADRPLVVGSVKTNIAHGESSAGMAGIIKTVLAMRSGIIPAHLHLRARSSRIEWGEGEIAVPTAAMPWPATGRPRRAGISGFGFSGTNAHVILEEAPAAPVNVAVERVRPAHLLVLSAASEEALAEMAGRYADRIAAVELADLCFSAATRRSRWAHRAAFVAPDATGLGEMLRRFAAGEEVAGASPVGGSKPAVAFLFTGQGAQNAGMGRDLYAAEPLFRETIDRCAAALDGVMDRPLAEILWPGDEAGRNALDETIHTQPALFAIEMALARLWQSWGIEPAAVMGHSVGEFGAACLAGVFTLEEAARLVAARGRLMQALPPDGAMAAVLCDESRARAALAGFEDRLAIAGVNAPENTIVSGEREALRRVTERLIADGVTVKPLKVSHAFHSPLMKPMLEEFRRVADGIGYAAPKIRIISNVTGEAAGPEIATAGYWVDHVMKPVLFGRSIETLIRDGCRAFVEIGPHPTLLGLARQCAGDDGGLSWIPSLRRDQPEPAEMLKGLGALWCLGARVDWNNVFGDHGGRVIDLPGYPFQRRSYWPRLSITPTAAVFGEIHEVTWRPLERPVAGDLPRNWIVLSGPGDTGASMAAALEARGCRVTRSENVDGLRRSVRDSGLIVDGIVDARGTRPEGEESLFQRSEELVSGAAELLRFAGEHPAARLWIVTRGARGRGTANPAAAALWGFGRTVALERPETWGGLVDLADAPRDDDAEGILAALAASRTEPQLGLAEGRLEACRLARVTEKPAGDFVPTPDGTCLVTGGLSGLGLAVAEWLVERGARHLLLVARRPPSDEARTAIGRMESRGAEVRIESADVSNADDVARVMKVVADNLPPLRGLFHAAGVIEDMTLDRLDASAIRRVMAPKVAGAVHLARASRALPLDALVFFSSASGVLGSPGQAHYAAANACLDAYALALRGAGIPALSVAWGPWADIGMAARLGESHRRALEGRGLRPMKPRRALEILGALTAHTGSRLVVDADWPALASTAPGLSSMLLDLAGSEVTAAGAREEKPLEAIRAAADPLAATERYIQDRVMKVLGLAESARPSPDTALNRIGVDSMMATELKNRIAKDLEAVVPIARFIDGTTIAGLARLAAPAAGSEWEEMLL